VGIGAGGRGGELAGTKEKLWSIQREAKSAKASPEKEKNRRGR